MSQSEFDKLLQKYLSGKCTIQEEKIILEWYKMLIRGSDLGLSEEEKSQIERRLWNVTKTSIQRADRQPGRKAGNTPLKIHAFLRMAAAACIVVLAGIGISHWVDSDKNKQLAGSHGPEGLSKYVNETANEKMLVLTDSTIIVLQPHASVDYPPFFSGNTREINLTGSAFFKVHHNPNKHFLVHLNGELTTEVLGTSFNIVQNKASDKIEVQVATGKVCVYSQQKKKTDADSVHMNRIILTPNQKLVFNPLNKQFITSLVNDPQPLKKDELKKSVAENINSNPFLFEDQPLDIVLNVLSEVYGINIIDEDKHLSRCHFTGNLSKYGLFKQLDIICQSTRSAYEINGTRIILKGEGCK